MTLPAVVLGSPEWLAGAATVLVVMVAVLAWSYARTGARASLRVCCATLKLLGILALVVCLVDPLLTGVKPRPGANVFLIVADDSQSMGISDGDPDRTRGDWVRELLADESDWRTRLGQEFDVRLYTFDAQLRAADGFGGMTFRGAGSSLTSSLEALGRRFRELPVAGVLLVSDFNATDAADIDWSGLPPVYPVVPPSSGTSRDLGVTRLTVDQTNFEESPVSLRAEVSANGYAGEKLTARVVNERGEEVESQRIEPTSDSETLNLRFQLKPEHSGVGFYRVEVGVEDDESDEQTLANNSRLAVVERGGGPYRVLYVSGRPNWEFKYLRRSLEEDAEVDLVGLIRIAKKQPKFDFRDPNSREASEFFKGFDNPDEETAERRDQPVLLRLGTKDEMELRTGFPQTPAELYSYHAVILDDVEAAFFDQDQLTLLRGFVSKRGGGFLMLGGPGSFADGKYARTPVGDLLPVYIDQMDRSPVGEDYRLVLTREGWLQPWVRTRKTEEDERRRLASMSAFRTVDRVGNVKPGAMVLAQVRDAAGKTHPALAAQQYGKGRAAALLVGDLWRWGMHRVDHTEDDFDRSWRQTIRWLVGDVPGRVEVEIRPDPESGGLEFAVRAADEEYVPQDNANVTVKVKQPDGDEVPLTALGDAREAGLYVAKFLPKQPGPYRVTAEVTGPDGKPVGQRETGFVSQPEADEFARMEPNHELMATIASNTGGEVVDARDDLSAFVESLSSRDAPITEPWAYPLWHSPFYGALALLCLFGEWGLRRINGLP